MFSDLYIKKQIIQDKYLKIEVFTIYKMLFII